MPAGARRAVPPQHWPEVLVTDKIVVFVTAPNRTEAKKIARRLVGRRLAACVNITEPVQSIYRWKGKVEEQKEFLLIIKTTRDLFKKLESEILKNHSYTTPEIICLPIIDGTPNYLAWIAKSVEPAGSSK
jgi:periplasmic divalent cation tolerance protein